MRLRRAALIGLAVLLVAVNLAAAWHAWRFTHPVLGPASTGRPETLTLGAKLRVLLTGVTFRRPAGGSDPSAFGRPWSEWRVDDGFGAYTPVWWVRAERARGTAVLVHGYGGARGDLFGVAQVYLDQGYDLLLPDLPGHGESPYRWTTLGAREAEVLAAVVRSADWARPLILHGQSMGAAALIGAAASDAAIHPRALVLEAPYGSLYDTTRRRFELMGLPSLPAAPLLLAWGGLLTGSNPFALNPIDPVGRLSAPVLLMGGADDRRVPPAVLRRIAARAADARLELFPGVGHRSLQAAAPDHYRQVLTDFLTTLRPAAPTPGLRSKEPDQRLPVNKANEVLPLKMTMHEKPHP